MHKYSHQFAINIYLKKFASIAEIDEIKSDTDDILSEQEVPDEEGSSVNGH
jgi:hypothetical protein